MPFRRPIWTLLAVAAATLGVLAPAAARGTVAGKAQTAARTAQPRHEAINCDSYYATELKLTVPVQVPCPDVVNPQAVFGHYVGHDEPNVDFYSNVPGSGTRERYQLTLPKSPPAPTPGMPVNARSYSFELQVAPWFGMSLCADRSFPELVKTCTPDSDVNIVNPKNSPYHAGSAYLELQFYPYCMGTDWCAATNIWSYYVNPVTGQQLNPDCADKVGGVELDNFAFLTLSGKPLGPPNPLASTTATFTPKAAQTLLMGQGDHVTVTVQDTRAGLLMQAQDHTNGKTGAMVASAANGFAQMAFAPPPSTTCKAIPYSFHPMYSTSSPATRSTWTAQTYNIAYSDETGHFDFCSAANSEGQCTGFEGAGKYREAADSSDTGCTVTNPAVFPYQGCGGNDYGFDGTSYIPDWPDGKPNHPTPWTFTSPVTGAHYTTNYQRVAFADDLPLNESATGSQPHCSQFIREPGGCTQIPYTDEGKPAAFYPFFSTTKINGCSWVEGNDIPGVTVNDFGKQKQFGRYVNGYYYTVLGGKALAYNPDFRQILNYNPCPATIP
jgi:hypothetical protein